MITIARKSLKGFKEYDRFVLGISLHNPNCAGDILGHIIDWINEQDNFKSGIVDLADTLNRHNYMLNDGLSEVEAIRKARHFGDVWISRHEKMLDKLNVPVTIMRWDRWLCHPKFQSTLKMYMQALQNNKGFRTAVTEDVTGFYARQGVFAHQLLPKEKRASMNYLLEEIAAHTLMYENIKAADIYPGKDLKSYAYVRSGKLDSVPLHLQNSFFTRLVFREDQQVADKRLLEQGNGKKAA